MGNEQSADPESEMSPSVVANRMPPTSFNEKYYHPVLSRVVWPQEYSLSTYTSANISEEDLKSCLQLVRTTSMDGYKASTWGWSEKKKLNEMKEKAMRFLIIRRSESQAQPQESVADAANVLGFLSFMLTVEDDIEVVYCYEVHLLPELRGQKLGATLMQIMEDIGKTAGMSKSMLTVFTSNTAATAFYERLGYTRYDEEAPPPRKRLRSRTTEQPKPTFVILAKDLG